MQIIFLIKQTLNAHRRKVLCEVLEKQILDTEKHKHLRNSGEKRTTMKKARTVREVGGKPDTYSIVKVKEKGSYWI